MATNSEKGGGQREVKALIDANDKRARRDRAKKMRTNIETRCVHAKRIDCVCSRAFENKADRMSATVLVMETHLRVAERRKSDLVGKTSIHIQRRR